MGLGTCQPSMDAMGAHGVHSAACVYRAGRANRACSCNFEYSTRNERTPYSVSVADRRVLRTHRGHFRVACFGRNIYARFFGRLAVLSFTRDLIDSTACLPSSKPARCTFTHLRLRISALVEEEEQRTRRRCLFARNANRLFVACAHSRFLNAAPCDASIFRAMRSSIESATSCIPQATPSESASLSSSLSLFLSLSLSLSSLFLSRSHALSFISPRLLSLSLSLLPLSFSLSRSLFHISSSHSPLRVLPCSARTDPPFSDEHQPAAHPSASPRLRKATRIQPALVLSYRYQTFVEAATISRRRVSRNSGAVSPLDELPRSSTSARALCKVQRIRTGNGERKTDFSTDAPFRYRDKGRFRSRLLY